MSAILGALCRPSRFSEVSLVRTTRKQISWAWVSCRHHVMYFLLGLRLHCQSKARAWSAFASFVLIRLGFHSILEFARIGLPPFLSKAVGWYLTFTAWTICLRLPSVSSVWEIWGRCMRGGLALPVGGED